MATQYTGDTFRALLKQLALSFDLALVIKPAPIPNGVGNTASRDRRPGFPLDGAQLESLFQHLAHRDFSSNPDNHAQIGAVLTMLRMTGLDRDPIVLSIAARVFLEAATAVEVAQQSTGADGVYPGLVDIVGTGGDGQDTYNVSTTAAILAASVPGVHVCKHGAKASSSTSGSVDLLIGLGVPLPDVPPSSLARMVERSPFAFLFAQHFHPALGPIGPIRKSLGFPTIFNILGPLINPARPNRSVMGVHSYALGRMYAEALRARGHIEKAWVVCGQEGLDEISVEGDTDVWELGNNGQIREFTVNPTRDFGLPSYPLTAVRSYSAAENASICLRILQSDYDALPDAPLTEASPLHAHELLPGTQAKQYPPLPAGTHLKALATYTLLQASAVLVVTDKAPTLKEAVALAKHSTRTSQGRAALDTFRALALQAVSCK